jgi:hypothetical protein
MAKPVPQANVLFTMHGRRIRALSMDETIVPVCYICSESIQEPGIPYTGCTPRYVKKAYQDQKTRGSAKELA